MYIFNYISYCSQVNIRVSVIDGVVHINNTKVEHATVMALHFFAEIGKGIVL